MWTKKIEKDKYAVKNTTKSTKPRQYARIIQTDINKYFSVTRISWHNVVELQECFDFAKLVMEVSQAAPSHPPNAPPAPPPPPPLQRPLPDSYSFRVEFDAPVTPYHWTR